MENYSVLLIHAKKEIMVDVYKQKSKKDLLILLVLVEWPYMTI